MDRASIKVQAFAYAWHAGFFLNAVPVVLVFLLLLSLFNRISLSLVVTFALTAALYIANYMKLKYLDVPASFSDVYVLENLHASTFDLLVNFTREGWLIVAVALVVAVVVGSIWLERAFFGRRSLVRAVLAVVVLFCMISLGAGARWVGSVYGADRLRVVPWTPLLTILHSGVIGTVAFTSAERTRVLDMPVDKAAVEKFVAMDTAPAPAVPATAGDKPDIVMIQSESFFEPAILKVVDSSASELPNLHRALASGVGGTMNVHVRRLDPAHRIRSAYRHPDGLLPRHRLSLSADHPEDHSQPDPPGAPGRLCDGCHPRQQRHVLEPQEGVQGDRFRQVHRRVAVSPRRHARWLVPLRCRHDRPDHRSA